MTKLRRTYILTSKIYSSIFTKYIGRFDNYITCKRCNEVIQIGQKIESNRSKSHQNYRHVKCPRGMKQGIYNA